MCGLSELPPFWKKPWYSKAGRQSGDLKLDTVSDQIRDGMRESDMGTNSIYQVVNWGLKPISDGIQNSHTCLTTTLPAFSKEFY